MFKRQLFYSSKNKTRSVVSRRQFPNGRLLAFTGVLAFIFCSGNVRREGEVSSGSVRWEGEVSSRSVCRGGEVSSGNVRREGWRGGMGAPLQGGYRVVNRIISYEGGGVHLSEADGVGLAWIKGQEFTTGEIAFDVKGRDVLQKSFVGIAFHGVNDSTYEAVYFRPFNFRTTDSLRRVHAVEYIAMPVYDWPKLRAEFPGKYEQPVSPAPDPTAWFHVRVVVMKEKISVFVNGAASPSLVVAPLVRTAGTQIGFWAGYGSDGDWRDIRIKPGSGN